MFRHSTEQEHTNLLQQLRERLQQGVVRLLALLVVLPEQRELLAQLALYLLQVGQRHAPAFRLHNHLLQCFCKCFASAKQRLANRLAGKKAEYVSTVENKGAKRTL